MHDPQAKGYVFVKNSNGLLLHGFLEDKIINNYKKLEDITFAKGFDGGITDLVVKLYVASGIWGTDEKIHKIGNRKPTVIGNSS